MDDDDGAASRTTTPRSRCASPRPRCCATRTSAPTTTTSCELAQQLMTRLRFAGPPRRSLQVPLVVGAALAPTCAATLRGAIGAGGEPIRRYWQEPGERLRRLVLLLDVSGSMEPYARAMLRFVHAAVAGRQRVEAFALGTRLTRVTKELNSRDPDQALRQASERVQDWSGGTRLGECLRQFNDEWGVRGMARGAIVVILSDGWDRGDPTVLGRADAAPATRHARPDLGQPVEGHAGLRAAGPWDGGGVAVC